MVRNDDQDNQSHWGADDVEQLTKAHKCKKSKQYDFKVLPVKKNIHEEEKTIVDHHTKGMDETNFEMNGFRMSHEDSSEFIK